MKKARRMNGFTLFLLISLLPFPQLKAQDREAEIAFSIPLKGVEAVSIDRFYNFYIADAKGNIEQFDPLGKTLVKFSPTKPGSISLLEAWQAVKIFAFSQDLQQGMYFDRFLAPIQNVNLAIPESGFIKLATLSNDNNIWLIDESDFSLKKYHLQQKNIIFNIPLNLQLQGSIFNFTHIREYQNHLFISDKNNGIFIFDNLGNILKTLPVSNVTYFNFLDDELYVMEGNDLSFYNIYSLKKRSVPLPSALYKFALATKDHLILFAPTKADFIKNK